MITRAAAILLAAGILSAGTAGAGEKAGRAEPPQPWLQGWARTISGQVLGYHSPYPDATTALLSRATDGKMAVEWETQPAPEDRSAATCPGSPPWPAAISRA